MLTSFLDTVMTTLPETMKMGVVNDIKVEAVLNSLKEDDFDDVDVKEKLIKLKKDWAHSPKGSADIGEGFLGLLAGYGAKSQFEHIMNVGIDDTTPVTNSIFHAMAGVAQASYITSFLEVIGGLIPLVNGQAIGTAVRAQFEATGTPQIVGFGYGNIMSEAIGPFVRQEMNTLFQKTQLGLGDMSHLFHRKLVTEEQFDAAANANGYHTELAAKFLEGSKYYPGPTDFIRFAVREVFNEKVVSEYKYDQDFPANMEDRVKRAGMSIEQLKWYWRAHWELPSPNLGFQMLHRGVISESKLKKLLQVSDYAPGWIDDMLAVSYTPYSRVDARRLFSDRVLSEEQYLTSLKDIGYNDDKAGKMLEWAKINRAGPEKDLTRSMVLKAYELGLVIPEDALKYLQELGYDLDESKLILELEDNRIGQQVTIEEIKVLNYRYSRDKMTIEEYNKSMGLLGLPMKKIEGERVKARQMHEKRIKLPTKADITDWFKKGLIKIEDFKVKLSSIGYQAGDIELFAKAVML